jgi:3-dehydroquinate dehydratase type I
LDAGADLVELRIDSLRSFRGWEKVLELEAPVILTNRPRREGGSFRGSEEKRISYLLKGMASGVSCVDLEFSTPARLAKPIFESFGATSVILSYHDFSGTPPVPRLMALAKRMEKKPCDLVKLVTTARDTKDNFRMLEFLVASRGQLEHPLIAFSMGKVGAPTRFIGAILGVPIIYAAAGERTAPGQLTVKETKAVLQRIFPWEVKD